MDLSWVSPPEVNSFHHDEEHQLNSPDSGKKRKLQDEQLGLPMSKHKFRGRCSGPPAHGSPNPTRVEIEETSEESTSFCRTNRRVDEGPDPSEVSSKDRSSSLAGDDRVQTEMASENPVFSCRPSSSSCWRLDDGDFRSKLYSLDSRVAKNADPRDKYSDLEDEILVEPEFEDSWEECSSPGAYDDYIEECADAAIEDFMLYSNDLAPNALANHPSGGGEFKQDARAGTRKPTIDQEFEQYFSMMML